MFRVPSSKVIVFVIWNLLFGIYADLLFLNLLAVFTNMGASLPDDNPLNG